MACPDAVNLGAMANPLEPPDDSSGTGSDPGLELVAGDKSADRVKLDASQ
jgi:hypothetical protein